MQLCEISQDSEKPQEIVHYPGLLTNILNRQEETFARTQKKESCEEGSLESSGAFGGKNERNKYLLLSPMFCHVQLLNPVRREKAGTW